MYMINTYSEEPCSHHTSAPTECRERVMKGGASHARRTVFAEVWCLSRADLRDGGRELFNQRVGWELENGVAREDASCPCGVRVYGLAPEPGQPPRRGQSYNVHVLRVGGHSFPHVWRCHSLPGSCVRGCVVTQT